MGKILEDTPEIAALEDKLGMVKDNEPVLKTVITNLKKITNVSTMLDLKKKNADSLLPPEGSLKKKNKTNVSANSSNATAPAATSTTASPATATAPAPDAAPATE